MGRLIGGEWHAEVKNDDTVDTGHQQTNFRAEIGGKRHLDDPERYHLYISRACPWAHGAVLTRDLLGLDDAITVDVVDPHRQNDGWEFTPDKEGCTVDSIHGSDFLREVYTAAEPNYTGRVSVPVLWDSEESTIVNEESDEIMQTLAATFADHRGIDLYPEARREEIDTLIDDLYRPLNRGVYMAGFAPTQGEYEAAAAAVFDALDHWESVLAKKRFLLSDLTLADLRLFATLVRFDVVYHTHFKLSRRRLVDYPNLWAYTRDIYQLPGVAETVHIPQIKAHYYRSHTDINPTGLVPEGPELSFEEPHDRQALAGSIPDGLSEVAVS